MTGSTNAQAIAMLEWYLAMGVDEAIGDAPVDWFAAAAAAKERPARPEPEPQARHYPAPAPAPAPRRPGFANVAPDEAVMDARERAAGANTLAELEKALADFTGCSLKATAKNTCFKRGSDEARVMFIGEGPGRDEDMQGLPFVGRAGKLLDRMLAAIDLDEKDAYITNIVYWRPPGNRTPTSEEVQACLPFLERQIELLDPECIILIGGPASHNLLGTKEGITRLRGKWRDLDIGGKTRRVMPMLHPAYLLRTPAAKRQAWQDLLKLKAALQHGSE